MNVQVAGYQIGPDQPCFIIAEIGINHNGSLDTAFKLIELAAAAGCNAVKFQKRTVSAVYTPEELAKPRQVDRSILESAILRGVLDFAAVQRLKSSDFRDSTNRDLKLALEFTIGEYAEIARYCAHCGILWSVSPWDIRAAEEMSHFKLPFIKVASACLTDNDLLRRIRNLYRVPVLLATGMSDMEEVCRAVEILGKQDLILLQATSTYPADESDLNFRVIQTYLEHFPDVPVGYSGHEKGTTLSVCAVAMGARVVERHITLDRTMPGSDHAASLEPEGNRRVISNIRRLEWAYGSGEKTCLQAEKPVKAKLRRGGTQIVVGR